MAGVSDQTGFPPFATMIEQLDPSIFTLESQTSINDRISLLRLQKFIRSRDDAYCYLEIGSHLGGSLLPHLADLRCAWAISIDPRPTSQPDERGVDFFYEENSTARMIAALRRHLPAASLERLQTFDMDAALVPHSQIQRPPRLALIDGEHTNVAAFSDFLSVMPLLARDSIIAYHDSDLVFDSIRNAERFLSYSAIPFRTLWLPDRVAAIGLGTMADSFSAEMSDVALAREQFLADARRQVQRSVALEYIDRGEMGFVTATRRAFRAYARKVSRGGPGSQK